MDDLDGFPYDLVLLRERIGGVELELEALDDFGRASVAVFRHAAGRVSPASLVDLSPMFGVLWPTARALAHRIASMDLAGRRVLELGCGLALPTFVAARLGADVVATDLHPHAGALFARNVRRNGIIGARYAPLDWRLPSAEVADRSFDLVLASDVLFARELPELVAATFARFLAPGAVGLLTDPGRAWLDETVDALRATGLRVTLDVIELARADGVDEGFLIEITRAEAGNG